MENRPLEPGESFFSVVREGGDGNLERQDISAKAWQGPPEDAIGWWRGRMPERGAAKLVLAPDAVLVDILRQLVANQQQPQLTYLLALLLLRRRVVRTVDGLREPESADHATVAVMAVEVIADGQTIEVPECAISRADSVRLRDELNELLYCEAE